MWTHPKTAQWASGRGQPQWRFSQRRFVRMAGLPRRADDPPLRSRNFRQRPAFSPTRVQKPGRFRNRCPQDAGRDVDLLRLAAADLHVHHDRGGRGRQGLRDRKRRKIRAGRVRPGEVDVSTRVLRALLTGSHIRTDRIENGARYVRSDLTCGGAHPFPTPLAHGAVLG